MYWIILWYVHQQILSYNRHPRQVQISLKIICLISLLFSGMKIHAQLSLQQIRIWQLNNKSDVSVQHPNQWWVGTWWITSQHDSAVLCHMTVWIHPVCFVVAVNISLAQYFVYQNTCFCGGRMILRKKVRCYSQWTICLSSNFMNRYA